MLGIGDFPGGEQSKSQQRTQEEPGKWSRRFTAAPVFPGNLNFILETRTDKSLEEVDW